MPAPRDRVQRFEYLAEKIENLIAEEGLGGEVEFSTDQYNNTMKVYYESTEQWDEKTERWRTWDEDEDRWVDDPPKERIVQWRVYAHRSKDSNYEAALDAGLTEEEVAQHSDLIYIGYEIEGLVTFDRETGKFTVEWDK